METTKARKQGNSMMITLASKFNVKAGQEFYVIKNDDGSFELIPKMEDYFLNSTDESWDFQDPDGEIQYNSQGREWSDE